MSVEHAEQAFRQALAMRVQQQDRAGEAHSLGEVGRLYVSMGRLEEAVTFFRQTADICVNLPDLLREGLVRNNLAGVLIALYRYDEARSELHRALECKQPFGHTARLWTTWDILYDLEQAIGNSQAAAHARQQAIQSYLGLSSGRWRESRV